jgi:hypothetical protein
MLTSPVPPPYPIVESIIKRRRRREEEREGFWPPQKIKVMPVAVD